MEKLFSKINGTSIISLGDVNKDQEKEFNERLKLFLYLGAIFKLSEKGEGLKVLNFLKEKLDDEPYEYILSECENARKKIREIRKVDFDMDVNVSDVNLIGYIFCKRYCNNTGVKMEDCSDLIAMYQKADKFLEKLFNMEIE